MANDDELEFSINATQGLDRLAQMISAFTGVNVTVDNLKRSMLELNAANEPVGGAITLQINKYTTLTGVLKETAEGYKFVSKVVRDNAKEIADAEKAVAAAIDAASTAAYKRSRDESRARAENAKRDAKQVADAEAEVAAAIARAGAAAYDRARDESRARAENAKRDAKQVADAEAEVAAAIDRASKVAYDRARDESRARAENAKRDAKQVADAEAEVAAAIDRAGKEAYNRARDESRARAENAKRDAKQVADAENAVAAAIDRAKKASLDRDKAEYDAHKENKKRREDSQREEHEAYAENKKRGAAITRDAQRQRNIAERNIAAAAASFAGGNLSFTALGRGANLPNAGLAANAGVGLAAGLGGLVADKLVSELQAGAERGAAFELQVARIQNITKAADSSTAAWSDKLLKLSNAYNVQAADVAKAAYEGVGKGALKSAQDTRVLEEALKLNRATGVDTTQAMAALNDVMAVYGGTAAHNSELLFQAAKRGGLGANEFADSISRVTSLAEPMGISLEEIIAALDVMHTKGITSGNAIAALSQLLQEFRKPSEVTREALTKLGGTFEQLVRDKGMVGAFAAVSNVIKASGKDVSEFLPNLRALRADLLLTADGAQAYNDQLSNLRKSQDELTKSTETAAGAPGQAWAAMLNDWDNKAQKAGVSINQLKDAIARALYAPEPGAAPVTYAKSPVQTVQEAAQRWFAKKIGLGQYLKPENPIENAIVGGGGASAIALNNDLSSHPPRFQNPSREDTVFLAKKAAFDNLEHLTIEHNLKMQKLDKNLLNVYQEQDKNYVEAIKRRAEAMREAKAKYEDEVDKAAFDRKVKAGALPGTLFRDQPEQLRKAREEDLQAKVSGIVGGYNKLRGKEFLDSKAPEDALRTEKELQELYAEDDAKLLAAAKTWQDREDAERKINEHVQERITLEQQLLDLQTKHKDQAEKVGNHDKANELARAAEELHAQGVPAEATDPIMAAASSMLDVGRVSKDPTGARAREQWAASLAKMEDAKKEAKKEPLPDNEIGPWTSLTAKQREELLKIGGTLLDSSSVVSDARKKKVADEVIARKEAARQAAKNLPGAIPGQGGYLGDPYVGSSTQGTAPHFSSHKVSVTDSDSTGLHAEWLASKERANWLAGKEEPDAQVEAFKSTTTTMEKLTVAGDSSTAALDKLTAKLLQLAGNYGGANDPSKYAPGDSFDEYQRVSNILRGQGLGGIPGFSEGGVVPGVGNSDSQLIAATPGEHVINQGASRTFAPLLEAINSFKGPTDASSTTNVGDINITVRGGSTASATVEEIGRGLRRAIRRGTLRFD